VKLIRLVNEADEELATYEIIINNTDVPGRVELQCIYVATELLPMTLPPHFVGPVAGQTGTFPRTASGEHRG
jgi:hypothetical protein